MSSEYRQYLLSPEWQVIRRAALDRDSGRCRICDRPDRVEVHHRRYSERGKENLDDLITLCHECHENFHATTSKKGMRKLALISKAPRKKTLGKVAPFQFPELPTPPSIHGCKLCGGGRNTKGQKYFVSGGLAACSQCFSEYDKFRRLIADVRGAKRKSVYVSEPSETLIYLASRIPSASLLHKLVDYASSICESKFKEGAYTDRMVRSIEQYEFDKELYAQWVILTCYRAK